MLHKAQELFGYLSNDLLITIAGSLKLPPSRVYGVATFYHFFSLAPQGEHTCAVCLGTACYVKGAAALLEAVEREAGIKAGATTPDSRLLADDRALPGCLWHRPGCAFSTARSPGMSRPSNWPAASVKCSGNV